MASGIYRLTDRPTGAKQYSPFFKGAKNTCFAAKACSVYVLITATPFVFRGNISDFPNKVQHNHFKDFEHPSLICFALFTEDLLIDWIVFYAVSPILLHNLTTLSRFTESLVYHLIWKKKIRNEKDCVILPTLRYPKCQLCRIYCN